MALLLLLLGWSAKLLLLAALLLLLGYLCYVKHVHMKYDHIPGPPRDSFLFGHSATYVELTRSGQLIHDRFLEW
ncbi:Cholesterol 24-hydroxylase [Liparis tanakae]|uniref:Cholesterol 24-hydroxylase n=1 Tax=Liparis tanakae TaxID=230148 RepID=A0A4Z2E1F0_9TELE|nr:Cholesterol 24-hydroxylase [Liparis tanakae]